MRWVVAAALVGHAVVLLLWPEAHTLLIDLQVYRASGAHLLAGTALYDGGVLLDLPFVYPPVAALLFVPLAAVPVPVLAAAWTLANLVLLWLVVRRCVPGADPWTVAALVAVATWLDPVRTTLYLGQVNVVLMALVALDLLGRPGRWWRGAGLGIAAAVKLTPLLFVAYLLVTRRFRAAATATAMFALATLLGFVVAPADSARYWFDGVAVAADRISDVAGPGNHSLNGFLARLGDGGQGPYLVGAALLAGLTLLVAARLHRRGDAVTGLALVGLCSAAAAPFAWSHHWVWFVPLAAVLAVRLAAREPHGRSGGAASVIVLVATAAVITRLPGPGVGPIPATGLISLFPDAYLVAFVLVLGCAALVGRPRERRGPRRDVPAGPST